MSSLPPIGHVLIVEDEPRLAAVVGAYLHAGGHSHDWIADGAQALGAFRAKKPDLVLLDLMLPNRDGLEICRDLRKESAVPVIMVTARVEEIDRLRGVEIGADDYICKPFSPREVAARVQAVLPRHRHDPYGAPAPGLHIDEDACRASVDGRALDLTQVAFRLL
ncbi:response regulator, partial [Xanthomonas oryzae]